MGCNRFDEGIWILDAKQSNPNEGIRHGLMALMKKLIMLKINAIGEVERKNTTMMQWHRNDEGIIVGLAV